MAVGPAADWPTVGTAFALVLGLPATILGWTIRRIIRGDLVPRVTLEQSERQTELYRQAWLAECEAHRETQAALVDGMAGSRVMAEFVESLRRRITAGDEP